MSGISAPGVVAIFSDAVVLQWAVGLFAAQLVVAAVFSSLPILNVKPGLAAHQVVVFFPFLFAATHGYHLWILDPAVEAMKNGTYVDRMYGATDGSWLLTRFMIGFQLWDLTVTLCVPTLRKAEHLGHHFATLLTALTAVQLGGPFFQWCAPFFLGFTEISSVPLALVDLFRGLPKLTGVSPILSAVNEVARVAFALSFLPIRCIGFPLCVFTVLLPDMISAWAANDIRCSMASFAWMLIVPILMTCLQWFWGAKIVRVLLKEKGILAGGGVDKGARDKEAD